MIEFCKYYNTNLRKFRVIGHNPYVIELIRAKKTDVDPVDRILD